MDMFVWLGVLLSLVADGGCHRLLPSSSHAEGGVRLEVVVPDSDQVLKEAPLSSPIQLRVVSTGRSRGVSVYQCQAVSDAGTHRVQLTDTTGCASSLSPMGCMVQKNGTVASPVFQLSSVADIGDVNITCLWDLCLTPRDPRCVNRCNYFTTHPMEPSSDLEDQRRQRHRTRRQQRDPRGPGHWEEEERGKTGTHSLSTTIRVLPSHVPRASGRGHHHHHHHHRHHSGEAGQAVQPSGSQEQDTRMGTGGMAPVDTVPLTPSPALLYLNPITCSLFLLVLCVFLGFYVSFARSLRRSVEDIRQEIERQRLRDKFLVPSC